MVCDKMEAISLSLTPLTLKMKIMTSAQGIVMKIKWDVHLTQELEIEDSYKSNFISSISVKIQATLVNVYMQKEKIMSLILSSRYF